MEQDNFLRKLIKTTEERYLSYKKMLEYMFKDKISFPLNDINVEWYKELLRDGKNQEEGILKELRLELEYHRSGLNPPTFYKYLIKNNIK